MYPLLKDNNFQKKIALKKEFQMKYDGEKKDILKEDQAGNLCKNDIFTLAPHQEFVKTFISHHTPYNGLLLYHGMGSGKTCSVIGICEEHRKYNKYNKEFKKILIVASPNIQENFKLQLFDSNKLEKKNGIWNLEGCVGESLLQEINMFQVSQLSHETIKKMIEKMIRKSYEFIGYESFGNKIKRLHKKYSNEKQIKKAMKQEFAHRMIVVDEVHNIRKSENNTTSGKIVAEGFKLLLKYVQKMKLLFLSGTPMFNNPREIVFLMNILNSNDQQSQIKERDIFDKQDNLIVDENGLKIGEEILKSKCNGYISYVRGENPFLFPFKIYPFDFENEKSILSIQYPRKQYNGSLIERPLQHLDLYMTTLSPQQKVVYRSIIQKIETTAIPDLMLLFSSIEEKQQARNKYEERKMLDRTNLQDALYALTLCVNENETYYTGKNALNVLVSNVSNQYEYVGKERSFDRDNIGKYSAKIKAILEAIENSEGIVLVYSQYLEAGLVPVALALEEHGYQRASKKNTNLFRETNTSSNKGSYAMITGDLKYSKSNKDELYIINSESNLHGNKCKVVLISQAGSEGLDFKNLRQVHVLEPWYNLNRIDQIVGRAIRNCSHKQLPLKKRNCQIFLHASILDNDEESIDLMMYRMAEQKASKIGAVQKVLKSVSVDCILNASQTQFANLHQEIEIKLSNKKQIVFDIADKSYSSICDYGICDHTCINQVLEEEQLDQSTFSYHHNHRPILIHQIKQLFQKKHIFKIDQIIEILKSSTIDELHIYHALDYLVNNKQEIFIDKFMRKGYLIHIKDLYIFQPLETNTQLSIEELTKPFRSRVSHLDHLFLSKKTQNTVVSLPQNDYEKILDNIEKEYEEKLELDKPIIRKLLNDTEKTFQEDYHYILFRIIESLSHKDEIICVKHLFQNGMKHSNITPKNNIESFLKNHLQQFLHLFEDTQVYFLVDLENKSKLKIANKSSGTIPSYITIYTYQDNQWIKANRTLVNTIGYDNIYKYLKSIISPEKIHDPFGYIDYYKTKYVVKIGELNKNKIFRGAMFANKIPELMKKTLNSVLDEEFFDTKDKKKYHKKDLIPLCEYLLFILNGSKIYYLNKLQLVSYGIKN